MEKAILAAGCFWGVEHLFRKVPGVADVKVGYTGGQKESPTYRDVCTGQTGHAEAVEIDYDPETITYGELIDIFFENHDPTTLNRQGPDIGTQYRSAIFYMNEEQKRLAEEKKKNWQESKKFTKEIVTEITQATIFYRAEEYHQRYFEKNGITGCGI